MTSLGSRQRVPKEHLRVQAYGTVDELNSHVGLAIALGVCEKLREPLVLIQNVLFNLGSDLCFLEEDKKKFQIPVIEKRHVDALEKQIDDIAEQVGPLENFILPGGTASASQLHVARTVCRRAEREAILLSRSEPVSEWSIPYLNRLSDALFMMARFDNKEQSMSEQLWNSRL